MTNSNTALECIALFNEVKQTYKTPAGYYCAVIPVGNVDETLSAPSVDILYLRVMDFLADQHALTDEDEAMLHGLISESQQDVMARLA